jgi:hypothetical protein
VWHIADEGQARLVRVVFVCASKTPCVTNRALMLNLQVDAKSMGNDDYQLSDHKYLILECSA